MYLKVLGQKLVVLDSIEAAVDLLDKRRPKYSNRPESAVLTLYVLPASQGRAMLRFPGLAWV